MWTYGPSFKACRTGYDGRSCCTTTPASPSGTSRSCWAGRRGRSRLICITRGPGSARCWGKPMGEPRDDIDIWLSERVKPLLPNPGTFERIRKRARRRKLAQVGIAAGGAAVIVAAAFTVPHFVLPRVSPTSAQSQGPAPRETPTPQPTHSATPSPSPSPSSPSPSATPAGLPPVPANFAPSSVTFVSTGVGWVIGQAGTPGQCTGPNPKICTSLAVTSNGGATWQGMPAPVAGPPDGARGVSGVRSLDGANGWAFGPQLYATHNRGQTWTKVDTHGMRVTDLETVNGYAFAVWARCTGTGPDFAAGCTSFSLCSTHAGVDQWSPVPGVTGLTSSGTGLVELCSGKAKSGRQGNKLVYSPDGGHWQLAGYAPRAGIAMSLSGTPDGHVLVATSSGIDVSANVAGQRRNGLRWRTVNGAALPGGFIYVGMTTSEQGVAVPNDTNLHALWFTYDGGRHWQQSAVH